MKSQNHRMASWLLAGMLIITVFQVFALPLEWTKLGSRKVNWGLDNDVIEVGGDAFYTSIRIEVTHGAMTMHKCTVFFENGTNQEVELRQNFAEGSSSRVVELTGGKRHIKKIGFWYDTKNASNSKAEVTVYGGI